MTQEEFKELDKTCLSLQNNTSIIATDITLLIRKFDENRKQIIMNTIETMKNNISFLESEVSLMNDKVSLIKA